MTEGHFLDGGRKRVGMGPSGTLFMIDDVLEWQPDDDAVRRGAQRFRWPRRDVVCVFRQTGIDITGIRLVKVRLQLAEGMVSIGVSKQLGAPPAWIAPPTR
jgi:hypothetical protein